MVDIQFVKNIIPHRIKDSHKGTYGKVCLIGGSTEYSGAIRLATMGYVALRSGAGLVTVACPKHIVQIISSNILENIIYSLDSNGEELLFNENEIDDIMSKNDAIVCGMGLGKSNGAREIIEYIIKNYDGKLVLDADALNIVSENINILKYKKSKMVFTPHLKEFQRLYNSYSNNIFDMENIKNNSEKYVLQFAKNYNIVIVLKGTVSIVTDGIDIRCVDKGTPGMATAGSGDVLSGILGGFLGYIQNIYDATTASVFVNGMAGELAAIKYGEISMTARDTVEFIPEAIKKICGD